MTSLIKNKLCDDIWHNNPGLVQLLGLCPLLAVSNTAITALGLALATLLTLLMSNISISLLRHIVRPEICRPVFLLIIATVVSAIELLMNAFWHELYLSLGIFVPLIIINGIVISRAESFAIKNSTLAAAVDALSMGVGFALALVTLGSLRELIGFGTLFAHAGLIFGAAANDFVFELNTDYRGFLLAILPPGAFIILGLLIAVKNMIDARIALRLSKT
ncbi:MAG: electron transport complex subunit E [Gammaproteobacteria bacterium]|nr:electron transport complex subunit E [Gammaproteobacteria bacterium]